MSPEPLIKKPIGSYGFLPISNRVIRTVKGDTN